MRSRSEGGRPHELRHRISFIALSALLLAALVGPPVTLMLAWRSADAEPSASAPVEYLLESSARTVTVGAKAHAVWSDLVVVRAPSWSGLITSVSVTVGQTVGNGATVARIDGIEVRHYVLASPIYRSVCAGDTALVSEVRSVLTVAGLGVGSAVRLGSRDVSSVRTYARMIGVENWREVACFDPGWVTVSAAPLGAISDVALSVGAAAPAEGEPVFTSGSSLASLSLKGDSGAASIDERLTRESASAFGGSELIINGMPTGVSLPELGNPDSLAGVGAMLKPVADDNGDSGSGTARARAESTVAVALTLSDTQFIVPATAVVAPLATRACVIDSASRQGVPVSVIGSSISGLIIDLGAPARPGMSVLISPLDSTCA